jgi:hypothetical protein
MFHYKIFPKKLFLFKLPQFFLLGVLHSSRFVGCRLYHLVLLFRLHYISTRRITLLS